MRIAAVDIGGTAIKYGLFGDDGVCVSNGETPTNRTEGGEGIVRQVIGILETFGEFDRIAVSTMGQVNPLEGSIIYGVDLSLRYAGTQIRKMLTERFGKPVVVENDVNCAALCEAVYGAGAGYKDVLCLAYGTGIGMGVIFDKTIFYGSGGFSAGEVGHIPIHAGGERCICGLRGCYEKYASTTALVDNVRKYTGADLNGRDIFAGMAGDPRLTEIVDRWIDEVIYGLAAVIHIFNPSCIVLGGGVMEDAYVIRKVDEKVRDFVMPSFRNFALKKAAYGNRAALYGAMHQSLRAGG